LVLTFNETGAISACKPGPAFPVETVSSPSEHIIAHLPDIRKTFEIYDAPRQGSLAYVGSLKP
jgi:hypothetical protein